LERRTILISYEKKSIKRLVQLKKLR